ncbi:MAG: VWA domain-containing protein [Acidobacteria bacterium]|nr:VWA domain-containing protein [Acidobacteriota bacterium]
MQEPKEAQKEEPVTIGATEVVVDVIVVDKKNWLVVDLAPTDFEIFEEGVKQTIKSVRLERSVEGEPKPTKEGQLAEPPPAGGAPVAARRLPNLIVLVFDNLSMSKQSQVFARRAGRDYVESLAANDRVAVFGIDTRLFLVQPFTNDKKALEKVIDQATSGTSQQFASSAAAVERLLQSSSEGGPAAAQLAGAEASTEMNAILLNTLRAFERFEREIQARATILSLLSIIRGQQLLPGRKTVIFFSEGFALPADLSLQFRSVISAANRSHVAFYTIDAGGLRLESEGERASQELNVMAGARARGADPTVVTGGESMLGRAESLGRMNRESVLTELAESTGGLAIRNTNDLRSALSRIDEDTRGYYILTYAPTNQNFDGRFRTIEVKVNRPDLKVRARSGYDALLTSDAAPVYAFERPLFEVLATPLAPHDFAFNVGAMHFPTASQAVNVSVVAQIPAGIVNFVEAQAAATDKKKKDQEEKKVYVGELGIMALVKDKHGMVVRKLSQNYRLTSVADKLNDLKRSNVIFDRTAPLTPGAYQVDFVARDAKSGQASVARTSLTVPAPQSTVLRISSIVPTTGGDTLRGQARDENNPFVYGNIVMMPNLTGKFSKLADQKMMLYFTVQATPSASVQAKAEFLQNGQVLARAPGALPAPDQTGRIQFIAEFPLAPFPEGTYDVRITVEDGTNRASEQMSFTVVN